MTFGFSGHTRKRASFSLANRAQGSASRKQFGMTGVRTAFSGGGFSAKSAAETVIGRYERLRQAAGRTGDISRMPEKHPDRGTPKYHNFLKTKAWLGPRDAKIAETPWCACCGANKDDFDLKGRPLHLEADHIKPRMMFPEFEDDPNNIQILCVMCNRAKGNNTADDWRVGSIPYGARGTFWHKRPAQLEKRNAIAKRIKRDIYA